RGDIKRRSQRLRVFRCSTPSTAFHGYHSQLLGVRPFTTIRKQPIILARRSVPRSLHLTMSPTVLAAILCVASTLIGVASFPTQGGATWLRPTSTDIIAECYPLTIKFTSPVAPHNISFWYYVGAQTDAGQTTPLITSWAKSEWVNGSTLYSVVSPSLPVAAGTMMALSIIDYDNTYSFLHQLVVQPNTDTSCITTADQYGIPSYNGLAEEPATTTVSPPATTSGTSASNTSTGGSSPTSVSTSSGAASPSPPSAAPVQAPKKSSNTGAIAGGTVGGILALAVVAAIGVWAGRRGRRRPAGTGEKLLPLVTAAGGASMYTDGSAPYTHTGGSATYIPEPYTPTLSPLLRGGSGAPIQEVDAGAIRLPPQYGAIDHDFPPASSAHTQSFTGSGAAMSATTAGQSESTSMSMGDSKRRSAR
ncbi:hypothetical protein B0H11DRAFT_2103741, partial [Mycena galericulata]